MSFSGEALVGLSSGVGTTVVTAVSIYVARKIRKAAARIEEVMKTPAELVDLRGVITGMQGVISQNTTAIGNLSSGMNNLSSVLDRLVPLVEQRVNGG